MIIYLPYAGGIFSFILNHVLRSSVWQKHPDLNFRVVNINNPRAQNQFEEALAISAREHRNVLEIVEKEMREFERVERKNLWAPELKRGIYG